MPKAQGDLMQAFQNPQPWCHLAQACWILAKMGNSASNLVLGPGLYRAQACVGARALCPVEAHHSRWYASPYGPIAGGRLKREGTPSRWRGVRGPKQVCRVCSEQGFPSSPEK